MRTPTKETPFMLAYGSDAVIPTNVGLTSYGWHTIRMKKMRNNFV